VVSWKLENIMKKILLLVEMMLQGGAKLPCLATGQAASDSLRHRFELGLTEDQCVEHVENLINQSSGNRRTKHYDAYQWYTRGILN